MLCIHVMKKEPSKPRRNFERRFSKPISFMEKKRVLYPKESHKGGESHAQAVTLSPPLTHPSGARERSNLSDVTQAKPVTEEDEEQSKRSSLPAEPVRMRSAVCDDEP